MRDPKWTRDARASGRVQRTVEHLRPRSPDDSASQMPNDSGQFSFAMSQTLLQQPRKAPPVGRVLRILLGLVLMVYVAPLYFRVPVRVAEGSLLLMLGLIGVYSLIHIVVSRHIVRFGPCLGAIVALGLLVALYVAGASGSPIFGHGKGELAVLMFLGVSLVVAGIRAVPGCELMAIPGVFFGKDTELACLIFSPLDGLERKLRGKRDV